MTDHFQNDDLLVRRISSILNEIDVYSRKSERVPWNANEDKLLIKLVNKQLSWRVIADELASIGGFPQRTPPQVSQRYRRVILRRKSMQQ